MKKLLVVVMACYGLNARSQTNTNRDFLYLFSDSLVQVNQVRVHQDYQGLWQVRADGRKVPIPQIKFASSADGYFANIKKMHFLGESELAERVTEGKLNIYERHNFMMRPQARYRYPAVRRSSKEIYYNKGFADLKRLNYANLKHDLTDNPRSMDLLEAYRKKKNTSTVMYVAAGASFVAGVVSLVSGSSNLSSSSNFNTFNSTQFRSFSSKDNTAGYLLISVGLGFSIAGFTIQNAGQRHLDAAINEYNR